jgi:phosphoheptose isomerase
VYELKKPGLRGVLGKQDADWLAGTVGEACKVDRLLSDDFLDEAARLSHGNGLSMADAMVLATALRRDADHRGLAGASVTTTTGPVAGCTIPDPSAY